MYSRVIIIKLHGRVFMYVGNSPISWVNLYVGFLRCAWNKTYASVALPVVHCIEDYRMVPCCGEPIMLSLVASPGAIDNLDNEHTESESYDPAFLYTDVFAACMNALLNSIIIVVYLLECIQYAYCMLCSLIDVQLWLYT